MYTPQSNWGRDVLRLYGNMMAKEIPHCDFRLFPICTFLFFFCGFVPLSYGIAKKLVFLMFALQVLYLEKLYADCFY